MEQTALDRHQLAGLDERERGFSRPVDFEQAGECYCAVLRYESTKVCTEPLPTQNAALLILIQTLHAQGYRQLRTQVSFRNGTYLGSQEMWIEYPDPPQPEPESTNFVTRFLNGFRLRSREERP